MAETMLTNSEWYVLDCLWEHAPQTMTQLAQALAQREGWAKGTTTTMLRRMTEKGLIRCEEGGAVVEPVEHSIWERNPVKFYALTHYLECEDIAVCICELIIKIIWDTETLDILKTGNDITIISYDTRLIHG